LPQSFSHLVIFVWGCRKQLCPQADFSWLIWTIQKISVSLHCNYHIDSYWGFNWMNITNAINHKIWD
jgi:hypothetical protein